MNLELENNSDTKIVKKIRNSRYFDAYIKLPSLNNFKFWGLVESGQS